MSSIASKVDSIRRLSIEPIPAGKPLKGATVYRTANTAVVVSKLGRIYSSSVTARRYYVSTSGALDATLDALAKLGVLTDAAVKEHRDDQQQRRVKRDRSYAAEDIFRCAKDLGLKLTKAQLAAIAKAKEQP